MDYFKAKVYLINKLFASKISKGEILLVKSQNQVRWLVYNYLNYDFLNKVNSIKGGNLSSPSLANNLTLVLNTLKQLNSSPYKFGFCLPIKRYIGEKDLLLLIKNYYFALKNKYQEIEKDNPSKFIQSDIKIEKIRYNQFNNPEDYSSVKKIQKLAKNNNDLIKTFLLHGSYATGDYIKGWSDLDTFAIIPKSVLISDKQMMKLRVLIHESSRYYQKIDPLQIHGLLLCTEFDLNAYSQSYFPFELMRYSRVLSGNTALKFRIRQYNDLDYWQTFLIEVIDYFLNLNPNKINEPIIKKMFIHRILNIPIYFLQLMGTHCYKKYSFELLKIFIESQDLRFFDEATAIMKRKSACGDLSSAQIISFKNKAYRIIKKNVRYILSEEKLC